MVPAPSLKDAWIWNGHLDGLLAPKGHILYQERKNPLQPQEKAAFKRA